MKWNKLTTRTLTDEEKELYPNYDFMWDGNTPDIGERLLVFSYGEVEIDTWEISVHMMWDLKIMMASQFLDKGDKVPTYIMLRGAH